LWVAFAAIALAAVLSLAVFAALPAPEPSVAGPTETTPSVQPTEATAARISCDGANLEVDTPVVRTQPDGVVWEVINTSDRTLEWTLGEIASGRVEPYATFREMLTIRPGTWLVGCASPPDAETAGPSAVGSLEIVDPDGYFTPWQLDCPPDGVYTREGPMEGAWGDPATPVAVAGRRLTGLESTDSLEQADYIGVADPVVRVMRNGSIVGYLLFAWDHGGWMLIQLAGCSGTSFDWSARSVAAPNPPGWFEWCPAGPWLEAEADWRQAASEAATQFTVAYAAGDEATLNQVLDASVPVGVQFAAALDGGAAPIVTDTDARGGYIVDDSCGSDVADHTVTATVKGGTEGSTVDFTVFLVFRGDEGWKVWGVR